MTEIYCTLGPSCSSVAVLEAMILQGMSGVRLNLSHVSLAQEEDLVAAVHTAFDHCEKPAQLIIDLQGPELRTGSFETPLELTEGNYVSLAALKLPEEAHFVLSPGKELLIGDGEILLAVTDERYAFVKRGGWLSSNKSVAIPGALIDLPPSTQRDRENVKLASQFGVTGVMQPFVRTAAELQSVRTMLEQEGASDVKLYAKIETAASISRLPELLPEADEIVVARGDLGNTMNLWNLPAAQKRIASACTEANVPFMVATQLISSMEKRAVPSRAEVSDIFNAVLDGAHSVMATGETAIGDYPTEVVRYLANTVRAAESYLEQSRS